RYFPRFMDRFEELLASVGLKNDEIIVRISGCPNGCARPYLAEIGLTGRAPGKYNLYLGASRAGERLSSLYLENIDEARIFAALTPLLQRYAGEREPGEAFGDFLARIGWDGTSPAEASTE
ncbi:MAG: sulfite reductase, partial [Methylothermaceae bacterium]|nr:sulfite reductase [Methylothermaceae bacterium]